ncbi:hypothetical protein [Pseudoduganella albidiflava]|nr:hypothetical protein [Pseudoduganella albidiflava]QBH99576.1 hypothetical protein EYF70_01005 [Pseudoduganella albidiflava]
MDIQAFAHMGAPWDFVTCFTDISVNDTLLASRIPVAASATHPHSKRTRLTIAIPARTRNCPVSTPRWAVHAAITAQVPHD